MSEDIQKHIKVYKTVFAALAVLTVVTVAVSYLEVSVAMAVVIALFVASIKASLVACYFMHLLSEEKFVYNVLILTFVFFVVMIGLVMWTHLGSIKV